MAEQRTFNPLVQGSTPWRPTEHHNVPDLRPSGEDGGLDWEQVADALRTAISSGTLPVGADLPSVRDLQEWQGIRRTTLQRAFRELSDEGLIVVRQGRTGVVVGDSPGTNSRVCGAGGRGLDTTARWPAARGMSAAR